MKHTISILVENHAGVLSRISGLFSRRSFNIDSLAVGVTDDPTVSRITIIVNGDEYTVEQVTKQLNKMVDVIKLKQLDSSSDICRELLLIKVRCNAKNRSDLIDIAQLMQAKISDLSQQQLYPGAQRHPPAPGADGGDAPSLRHPGGGPYRRHCFTARHRSSLMIHSPSHPLQ